MPDASVDCVVTDPPYGLSFMGKRWDYDVPSVDVWRECLRVMKPGAHLLSFGGSRTYHRMTCNVEDAGLEIRDQIMWVYGSGFPKSHNLEGEWSGWGTALKPAHEPIVLARKPLVGTVAANVAEYGCGALNIDGCRVGTDGGTTRSGQAPYAESGWRTGHDIVTLNAGRWPANLIHDGSDEVVAGFPVTGVSAGGRSGHTAAYSGGFKQEHYGDQRPGFGDAGSASRYFYCAKASKADRDAGCDGLESRQVSYMNTHGGNADKGETWHPIDDKTGKERDRFQAKSRNHHPTVKPTDLMRYLCRLVTPPGGTVLDPFTGSGSTGRGAILEGFNFIGIERDAEYADIARRRCREAEESVALVAGAQS